MATQTQYQVNITMTGDTVTSLVDNSFNLYGFKVVQSSGGGSPVVWFQTNDFALNTNISWTESYQAYTSLKDITPNATIVADASYPATPSQTLTVSSPMGIGDVADTAGATGALKQGIAILNKTSTQFSCGLSQQQPNGSFGPICAFPLFGHNMNVIVPVEQIFLMFSTLQVNTGAVIEQAYGPGLLINMTGSTTQAVSYDINNGWSWAEQASWAQALPPNENLKPMLILPVATLGQP